MNPFNPERASNQGAGEFDSRDCVNIVSDEPGDCTVRPPSPEMFNWFAAERDRLAKIGYNLDGTSKNEPK
jgi:hypothetical protein